MNDVPDWLWQGLTVWAAGKAIEWAWMHRKEIKLKVRARLSPPTQTLIGGGIPSLAQAGGGNLQVIRPYGGLPTGRAGTPTLSVQEAVTPSLARRLEELASWYLHVS